MASIWNHSLKTHTIELLTTTTICMASMWLQLSYLFSKTLFNILPILPNMEIQTHIGARDWRQMYRNRYRQKNDIGTELSKSIGIAQYLRERIAIGWVSISSYWNGMQMTGDSASAEKCRSYCEWGSYCIGDRLKAWEKIAVDRMGACHCPFS
jgi:hypothetical protein